MSAASKTSDKKMLLILGGAVVVLIAVIALLAPKNPVNDPRPTTTNNGPRGAKAAYLVLEKMGRSTARWNETLAELNGSMDDAQAARTTLVLADPTFSPSELKPLQQELARFMERGGRVLATGYGGGTLLPGGDEMKAGPMLEGPLCYTTPEGPGVLAQAGSVEMNAPVVWGSESARFDVEQRCGGGAVVVNYAVGKGEAVWWCSAWPMENSELKNDADLRLLLASLGDGRDVVFDESLHGLPKTFWDAAHGLPIGWLKLQGALLLLLLVFSFSRRRGPLRAPVAVPRTSPVEFAISMGDLYEKGGATSAATEAAKRRLLRVLVREAGVSQQSVQKGPAGIAEALQARLGGDWALLREHLERCEEMRHGKVSARSALALVRALIEDAKAVRAKLTPAAGDAVVEKAAA